jgi:ketosteroid isomerase-like protein
MIHLRTLLPVLPLSLVLGTAIGICQHNKPSPALSALVAAERAFAKTSVEKGIRASFLEFFAEDGINFQPHPTKTREAFLKRPAPATKPPVTLNWEPVYADVSRAGDLGYTTGPYTFTDQSPQKQPPSYGFYFSIWKKQADGAWKVVLDCGIDTPEHSNQTFVFKAAPPVQPQKLSARFDLQSERAALIGLDNKFLEAAGSRGVAAAYADFLADHSRVHRNNIFPVIGKEGARSFLWEKVAQLSWTPIASDVSQSDDLGYTYGSYDMKYREAGKTEKGYYVRVWRRDGKGDWKLVLDTFSPIPAEK